MSGIGDWRTQEYIALHKRTRIKKNDHNHRINKKQSRVDLIRYKNGSTAQTDNRECALHCSFFVFQTIELVDAVMETGNHPALTFVHNHRRRARALRQSQRSQRSSIAAATGAS